MYIIKQLARYLSDVPVEDDAELPIDLDLQRLHFENQYEEPEKPADDVIDDLEPEFAHLPITAFNFNELDDSTDVTDSIPQEPAGRRLEVPAINDPEDMSELIEHHHYFYNTMSEIEMALGIYASNTGMSRPQYAALRQILSQSDDRRHEEAECSYRFTLLSHGS